MSIFLSGGGGGCEAGLAVRESGVGRAVRGYGYGPMLTIFHIGTIRENFFAAHSLFLVYS